MDDFISDLLRQLTESLDDIMAIEDEKFAFYIAEPKNRFEFIDKKEIEG